MAISGRARCAVATLAALIPFSSAVASADEDRRTICVALNRDSSAEGFRGLAKLIADTPNTPTLPDANGEIATVIHEYCPQYKDALLAYLLDYARVR
jgi:nitrogenase subunit NifH